MTLGERLAILLVIGVCAVAFLLELAQNWRKGRHPADCPWCERDDPGVLASEAVAVCDHVAPAENGAVGVVDAAEVIPRR